MRALIAGVVPTLRCGRPLIFRCRWCVPTRLLAWASLAAGRPGVITFEQTTQTDHGRHDFMWAAWYLHKVDQYSRLAEEATDPCERARFISNRHSWLQILATELGADETAFEAAIAVVQTAGDD
jgi:hypothetical protein